MGMNAIPFKDLKPDSYFSEAVYLDEDYILITPEVPLSSAMLSKLAEWEFREVLTSGEVLEHREQPEAYPDEQDDSSTEVSQISSHSADDKETLEKVAAIYGQFVKYTDSVFNRYVTKEELNLKEISDKIKSMLDNLNEYKRYILRLLNSPSVSSNYLVNHAARSTILSMVIGSHIKLPPHRLIELGVAALLHEIGMIRLPSQLYMVGRKLSENERKSITAHPILSYNILKDRKFPLSISLAALEHHERVNGSGYPRGLTGDKISLYAKILAVACSYDAVTASRPYKEAREGYTGIMDILKNEGKKYDDTIIKALVYSLSLYPIGTYVLLSNGKVGQVIDTNPENPRMPIVRVLGSKTPDGKEIIVNTSEQGIHVQEPVKREDAEKLIT
ncbi:HD-GYP domain-containing protein [Spirochaetota bacterium]